jgi:hypothetical protein
MVAGNLAAGCAGQAGVMIRISHVPLPAGLSALAQRGPDDELTVYVSDALPAGRQRAAVRTALRASRRRDWRTLLPAPSVALLALGMGWLRKAAGMLRAHWVAWGAASAVVAVGSAAVYLAAVPHGHGPVSAARPPAPVASPSPVPSQPASQPAAAHPRTSPRVHPTRGAGAAAAAPVGSPQSVATLAPQPTPAANVPSSTPSPSASPAPSPSPSPQNSGPCIILLGIKVCVGVTG